jgi:hypothetical protein
MVVSTDITYKTKNSTTTYQFYADGQLQSGSSRVVVPSMSKMTFALAFYSNVTLIELSSIEYECVHTGVLLHYKGSVKTSTNGGFYYTYRFGKIN